MYEKFFEEGESYWHIDYANEAFVLCVDVQESGDVALGILWVDPHMKHTVSADELIVPQNNLHEWNKVKLEV